MNRVQRAEISKMPVNSDEYKVAKTICRQTMDEDVKNSVTAQWSFFRNVLINVRSDSFFGQIKKERIDNLL